MNACKRPKIQQPTDTSIRYIALTQGKIAIVSAHRYKELVRFNWCAKKELGGWYAVSRINGKHTKMHRFILDAPIGNAVDHRNGDGLDNRDDNLRFSTQTQNMANRRRGKSNTSGYKGVTKVGKKWRAQLNYLDRLGKRVSPKLGLFTTPQEAHAAYIEKARDVWGEFANAG